MSATDSLVLVWGVGTAWGGNYGRANMRTRDAGPTDTRAYWARTLISISKKINKPGGADALFQKHSRLYHEDRK